MKDIKIQRCIFIKKTDSKGIRRAKTDPKNNACAAKILIILIGLICLTCSCVEVSKSGKKPEKSELPRGLHVYKYFKTVPTVKVLLFKDVDEITISVAYPLEIYAIKNPLTEGNRNLSLAAISGNKLGKTEAGEDRELIGKFKNLPLSTISMAESQIKIGTKIFDKEALEISVEKDGEIRLNGVSYRGRVRFIPQINGRFLIVEELDMESYLAGVLGSEMPGGWENQALFSQAVAARTYALYKKKKQNNEAYHIDRLEMAYNGKTKESQKIWEIVEKSKGIIMVYDWLIFPGYFHSTCGGHTEGVDHVFNEKPFPPLKGVECGYCNASKYFRWQTEIGKREISEKLRTSGLNVNDRFSIQSEDFGQGGHASIIELIDSSGIKKMDANKFRLLIGQNKLFSTAFESCDNNQSIKFSGKGWGHGVGLCQYGAQNMANSGFKWHEILQHYYPEVELVKIY